MCFSYMWFHVMVKDTRVDDPFRKKLPTDVRYVQTGIDRSNNNSNENVILDLNETEQTFIFWRVHVLKGKQSKRIQYLERAQGTYDIISGGPSTNTSADQNINAPPTNEQRLTLHFAHHTGDTRLTPLLNVEKVPFDINILLTVSSNGRKCLVMDGLDVKYCKGSEVNTLYLQPNTE